MIKRGIFLIVFIIYAASALAVNYYIDPNGNDNNPGTQAQPWKTISKVNSVTFQPGDNILFKKGGNWHGQITVKGSGTEGNPITFSSYGSGAKPFIDCAQVITGWSVYNGNIYQADVSFNVQQVFLDGDFMDLAHHPNNGGRLYTNKGGKYWFVDTDPVFSNSVVGGGAIIHTRQWEWEYVKIEGYDPAKNNITFDGWGPSVYDVPAGQPYVLTDKLWMLDSPGEWYYGSGKLYVWMPDNSHPNTHTILASRYEKGIFGESTDHIIVDGFEIWHAAHSGVYFRRSNDIVVRNCEIYNTGSYRFRDIWNHDGNGIYIWESDSGPYDDNEALVENNIIKNALRRGVYNTRYRKLEVSHNYIDNIGLVGMPDLHAQGSGISGGGHKHHNVVQKTSYIGIAGGGRIENNYVNNTCIYIFDGGGIYVGGIVGYDRWIVGNVVENTGDDIINDQTMSIYLDASANRVHVINNTVIFGRRGVYVHTGSDNVLQGNTVYACRWPLSVQRDSLTSGTTTNNLWEDNIAVNSIDEPLVHNANQKDEQYDFGDYDYNTYSSPNSDNVVNESYRNLNYPIGPWKYRNRYSLPEWQDARGQDLNSVFVPQPDGTIIIVNRELSPQSFSNPDGRNYKYLDGAVVSWPVTLKALSSKILLLDSGGCTPECNQDSDCGSNPCMSYTCNNPGACSASCSSTQITGCIDDDGCCPSGCSITNDNDCSSGSLIVYYSMDIEEGVVPDKAGNNDAAIMGNPQVVVGTMGDALHFDGDDHLDTGFADDLEEWTVSVWANGDSVPDSDLNSGPVMKLENFLISWNHQAATFRSAAGLKVGTNWYPASFGTLTSGTWTHLAATYDGENLRAYKDGSLVTENSDMSGPASGSAYNMMIAKHSMNDQFFEGSVDEVRIFDYAMSASDIQDLYDCHPADSDCSGCVEMDELLPYIEKWKQNQVVIGDLMDAIAIWKECS